MREIKFRAWHRIENKMADLKKLTPFAIDPKLRLDGIFLPFNEDFILMQYTGLKDKNGKEIYEGDILRVTEEDTTEFMASVVWGEQYPAFTLEPEIGAEYNELQHACLVATCEVIGNIYENPELIKQ